MARRDQTAIVQLKVRLREPLRAKLEKAAKQKGISLNSEIVERLEHSTERLGLLREILEIAYGREWGHFLASAHQAGILTFRDQDKETIREVLNKFIDSLPQKARS